MSVTFCVRQKVPYKKCVSEIFESSDFDECEDYFLDKESKTNLYLEMIAKENIPEEGTIRCHLIRNGNVN